MRLPSALLAAMGILATGCTSSPTGTATGSTVGGDPRDAGASDATTAIDASAIGTKLSGNLGALGAVKPTVSSLWISTLGETLVYFSSAQLTCDQVKKLRWLGTVTAGAQVVELVRAGAPMVGTTAVPPATVSYAEGGKASSSEVGATGGSITFTKAEANGAIEGTFTASFDGGDTLEGTFHAAFCAGGQDF